MSPATVIQTETEDPSNSRHLNCFSAGPDTKNTLHSLQQQGQREQQQSICQCEHKCKKEPEAST